MSQLSSSCRCGVHAVDRSLGHFVEAPPQFQVAVASCVMRSLSTRRAAGAGGVVVLCSCRRAGCVPTSPVASVAKVHAVERIEPIRTVEKILGKFRLRWASAPLLIGVWGVKFIATTAGKLSESLDAYAPRA